MLIPKFAPAFRVYRDGRTGVLYNVRRKDIDKLPCSFYRVQAATAGETFNPADFDERGRHWLESFAEFQL